MIETFYIKKCFNCGAKFLYQYDDLHYCGYSCDIFQCVQCPQCNCEIEVLIKRKYRGKMPNE